MWRHILQPTFDRRNYLHRYQGHHFGHQSHSMNGAHCLRQYLESPQLHRLHDGQVLAWYPDTLQNHVPSSRGLTCQGKESSRFVAER